MLQVAFIFKGVEGADKLVLHCAPVPWGQEGRYKHHMMLKLQEVGVRIWQEVAHLSSVSRDFLNPFVS